MHRWNNDQLFRSVYLLAFDGKKVYVGQSVSPARRIKAHRRQWHESFSPLVVASLVTDESGILDLEYAWRWRAHLSGWNVINLQGSMFDLLLIRESARQHGETLTWPSFT
jgi:predicted GIY-YIG superfamily endonuclease